MSSSPRAHKRWLLGLLAALAIPAGVASENPALIGFSKEERQRIAAHGPWPPTHGRDPSNAADGRRDAVELGRQLFSNQQLSQSGQLSCGTCHEPDRGFQDGRRFTRHGRNTPGLLDVRYQRWFGWDGAHDSLWAASLAPLTAADELAATPARVAAALRGDPKLLRRYRRVFGEPQHGDLAADERLLVNTAKALAAYLATLVSPRTDFDAFRDALLRNDTVAAARYPQAAQRGLQIFIGKGRCFFCHTGATFSNGEFADIGRPFFTAAGADPGRWGGLNRLLASPYTRLGSHADAPPDDARAWSTRHVVQEPRHFGEFKVPGLRGLMASAPYFHDGSAATLEDVLRHYSELDESRIHADGVRLLQPLRLTAQELADLTSFLATLSVPPKSQQRR